MSKKIEHLYMYMFKKEVQIASVIENKLGESLLKILIDITRIQLYR